ncbi:MAG: SPOR domain-containing protein [bacterium]
MKKIFLLCGIILLTAFINNAKAVDTYYTVVISSVKSAQSAQKLADDMIKKGFEANVMLVNLNNGTTNRVCIGKSTTKDGAEEIQKKLAKAGYSSSWIAIINGPDEQKAVVKKLPEKKPAPEKLEFAQNVEVDYITEKESKPVAQPYTVDVITTEKVAEKNTAIATKKEISTIPTPPDVDKLPLAVPKEFSGNRSDNTADTDGKNVVIYNVKVGQADDKTSGTTVYEILTEGNQPITVDTLTTITASSNDVIVYHVGVGNQPVDAQTETYIITPSTSSQIITNDVLITSTDVTVSPGTVTTYEFTTQEDPNLISNDVLITRNEPFPIKTNSTDSLVILTAAPEAQVIQSQPLSSKDGDVVVHTVNVGTAQPETPPMTTQHITVATISPAKSDVSVKPIETEKNPKLESLIPGTNLSYTQFYTEIKKIFYALEKYSLASGTLLNEYIDPTYGTYIRYRNNDIVDYEKMVKPKDIYKNPQVKSNVLMFFQDMVKVRRQPPVVEQLPKYDCALKHVPGLNIYLSSLAKDNKFYEETVKCLNSDDTALTDIETANILEANKSINAAFAIGSSELVKAVYFAVVGDKVYIRYIDMYDNCEKK